MMLPGCETAGRAAPPPSEPVVVVRTVRETPPAELTRCPVRPRGLPVDGQAVIPPHWRAGIGRLAVSHGAILQQLERLIAWNNGTACPGATPE